MKAFKDCFFKFIEILEFHDENNMKRKLRFSPIAIAHMGRMKILKFFLKTDFEIIQILLKIPFL